MRLYNFILPMMLSGCLSAMAQSVTTADISVETLSGEALSQVLQKVGRIEIAGNDLVLRNWDGEVLMSRPIDETRMLIITPTPKASDPVDPEDPFGPIVPIPIPNPFNALDDVKADAIHIFPQGDVIRVEGIAMGEPIRLFSLDGKQAAKSTSGSINTSDLPKGIYFLLVGNKAVRITKK